MRLQKQCRVVGSFLQQAVKALMIPVLVSLAETGLGGTVNLATGNAAGNSWLTASDWNPAGVPSSGNAYVVSISALRSPPSVDPVFGGDSLTLNANGVLFMKHTNTMTVADLRLNGGKLASAQGVDVGVAGGVTVSANSEIGFNLNSRKILLSATLSGSKNISVTDAGSTEPVLILLADNPSYYGVWTVGAKTTLQAGAGGTAGSFGAGAVITNNGTLVFNRSNTYAVNSLIVGTGVVQNAGSGTTVLYATNTFSGETRVTNGTLRLTHEACLSTNTKVSVSLTGQLALDFVGTNTVRELYTNGVMLVAGVYGAGDLSGKLSGTGYLRTTHYVANLTTANALGESWLTASGWTPAGVPSLAGDYFVSIERLRTPASLDPKFPGGTLTLNSSGALNLKHSGTADIPDLRLNGGTIRTGEVFDQGLSGQISVGAKSTLELGSSACRMLLASVLTGGGGLTVVNSGAAAPCVVLLNDNSGYTGSWTVNVGAVLQAGNGGTSGAFGGGNVTNSGAVVFDRSNDYVCTNVISGTGSVTNRGGGTVTLVGASTYTGATAITNGTLLVNGSLAGSSAVTVFAGGALGGTGTVGSVTAKSGATVTGGGTNTVGKLTASTLTLQSGAVIGWNYDRAANTADVINVTGVLTLPAAATVNISGVGALPSRGLLLSSGSPLAGATDLRGWTINGGPGRGTWVEIEGNSVYVVSRPGTLIRVF